jgi:hypothetical protein
MTLKYLNLHRRTIKSHPPFPISHWVRDLSCCVGENIALISNDTIPLLPPPHYSDICRIVASMKNSRTPGDDGLHIEFVKSSPTLAAECLAPQKRKPLKIYKIINKNEISAIFISNQVA